MKKLDVEVVKCKHHVRGYVCYEGKRILPLRCSFGNKDVPGPVPHRFRKSLKLTVREFEELRDCTLSRDDYLVILHRLGLIG